jgi:hypothetical protein
MKSPSELAYRLARQWENSDLREARLIGDADWPVSMPIGRPTAQTVADDWQMVSQHIKDWRTVRSGQVVWESVTFRATRDPISIPTFWEISSASEWVDAAADRTVTDEYSSLSRILASSDPLFHPLFVRQRSLWSDKPLSEIFKATELTSILEPACAHGAPLRALSLAGIDSKFFERHRGLILRLLDLRFDGEASRQGLETFLDAWQELDHWLLVADLDGGLLPFSEQRVRSSELLKVDLAVCHLLIVENERCLHLLPRAQPGTIVVLGAGNNLRWLDAPWVQRAEVAYWGDIDTWGLTLLASARSMVPGLTALLMSQNDFNRFAEKHAVAETVIAHPDPPEPLSAAEKALYNHLLTCERGRLEQEFFSHDAVKDCLSEWLSKNFERVQTRETS